jgi:hypothetical protein
MNCYRLSFSATVASYLLSVGHWIYGHPATALGFTMLTIMGIATTASIRGTSANG